jgi:peptidoglycan/LPS O-acetylase OafA/YrhL
MSDGKELSRIPCLDGIRAVAALMVMMFHFIGHRGESQRIMHYAVIGQTGVDLFFVLSGFLITRILMRSKNDEHYFRTFYTRRVLRIFPLYFLFLIIFFFLLPPLLSQPIPSFHSQIWTWLYLQNIPATFPGFQSSGPDHFWSLAVEEHFYLIWPLMVIVLSPKRFMNLVFITLAFPPVLRLIFESLGIGVYYFTLTRMDSLAFGALLAALLGDNELGRKRFVLLFRFLLVAIPALFLPTFVLFSGDGLGWIQVIKISLIPAFYFALIGFCLVDPSSRYLAGMFSFKWLRWLGTISYGLYVFHPTCFTIVQRFVGPVNYFIDVGLSFGLTVALAYLSFRFFESPFLRLKRRFGYGLRDTSGSAEQPVI